MTRQQQNHEWVGVMGAMRSSGRSQQWLYRMAALGRLESRESASGTLQFRAADLRRLVQDEQEQPVTAA